MLSESELAMLEERCRAVPLTTSEYVATDYVMALFDTVLDYQNHVETIRKAGEHFTANHWDEIRTLDNLEDVLAGFPDDQDGNRELATYLWGNRHWRRARELRGLAAYFRERDVIDLASLRRWAAGSRPGDFLGYVKGLGPAVYRWLVMRAGVETIKPDTHILRFVGSAIGRPVSEDEAVSSLESVAGRLGLQARVLDWSIWESERGGGAVGAGTVGSVSTPRVGT
jgi:hypothetical protein